MRWWLALCFALVAATTAAAVAQIASHRTEEAIRERAQTFAAGAALQAAVRVSDAAPADRQRATVRAAEQTRVALFVFDEEGVPQSAAESRGIPFDAIVHGEEALETALAGRRYIETRPEVRATIVALPLRGDAPGALVAYAPHPDLAAGFGILRRELVAAAWWALMLGAVVGVLVATLIALRLRRIGRAAAVIAAGDFSVPLRSRFPDELGDLTATIEMMRARLEQSFQTLEAERDRLRTLLERLEEGVVAVNASDARVEFANAAAERLVPGLKVGEELPEPWPSASLKGIVATLADDPAAPRDLTVETDDERTFGILALPPRERVTDSVVLVLSDLSERERRERAEREFVTNASHELRTPLTTILGAVEALQAGAKEVPDERDRFLEHIRRESSRLVRLTRALLVLARAQTRVQAPLLRSVRLRPLLDDVASAVAPAPGVELEIVCRRDLAVLAEPDLLEQMLTNLLVNAAEHTRRGRITIAARAGAAGTTIEVTDTGAGVAPSAATRVFERFYRPSGRSTGGGGFGLGLAIADEAVRAMGGKIVLSSQPGRGTTVTVTLPSAEAEAA